ncbi:hypothetical protein SU48_11470 [Deinococcus puniceus]|uniref:BD-FAE-like domain-containing protein n=1 Tax=Deinococcus puniceus TaxID=1182568 RepID=A0A172TDD1_9DEIO|nr:hypothetical protein SU48_11470 [Deinococcus puniceus]
MEERGIDTSHEGPRDRGISIPSSRAFVAVAINPCVETLVGKYAVDNQFLAGQGYVTVSIDYRLAGEALFPAQIHDVKTSVRWLRAHATELMIDPSRIGVWGISAGGHLAGLVGTSSGIRELEGEDGGWADQDSSVQAVASVCGPMLFNELSWIHGEGPFPLFGERIKDVPETAALASPFTHVSPYTPPFAFVHGKQDAVVPVVQSRLMHERLLEAERPTELHMIEGGHEINMTHQVEMQRYLSAFFSRALKHTV